MSSRSRVPPLAASKSPIRAVLASVNAPRSWPNSSDSTSVSGRAAQFTLMNGWEPRGPRRCNHPASRLFPVPVSPSIKIGGRPFPSLWSDASIMSSVLRTPARLCPKKKSSASLGECSASVNTRPGRLTTFSADPGKALSEEKVVSLPGRVFTDAELVAPRYASLFAAAHERYRHFIRLKRLGEVITRAMAHCLHGILDSSICRHHDHAGVFRKRSLPEQI